MQKTRLLTGILMTLAAAIVIVYFYPHTEADSFNYEQGRPWNYAKLIAPFDIEIYPDSLTSQRLRDSLDAHYEPVFDFDKSAADSIIAALPDGPARTRDLISAKLRSFYRRGVVDNNIRQEITSGKLKSIRVPDDKEHNVLNTMNTEALLSPLEIYRDLDASITDSAGRHFLSVARLETLLTPNITLNPEENKKVYNSFLAQLEGARGVIQQGQTIIDKGMIITPQDYVNLQTYEHKLATFHTKQTRHEYLVWTGQFLYVVTLLTALLLYIYNYCPEMMRTRRSIIFLLSCITVSFLLCVGLDKALTDGIYLVPLTIVPILILVFFNARTAIYVSLVLTLIAAGITSYTLEFIFLQFCATIGAVNSLRELRNRAQLLRTSLVVAGCYLVSYTALELLMNGSFSGFSWRTVAFLAINSALTSVTYVMMFLVERIFGFVSVVTLVELADINNPLLKKLSDDCPGTFNHSMAVSNLASDAAQYIGANVQLVRAGALYHDIGKMKNPAFFTENQHGVNPHDTLSPEQSARIIIAHVTDGVKLADKNGLPDVIKNFIREHHGRGLAKYFYFTECNRHPETKTDPAPYTYPGPDPQSKETSVLMMADAVEAASRSLKEHTPEAIRDLVNRIIDGQIADGLHNQSTLEFKDIAPIKQAFIKRLGTIYHSRISYPAAPGSNTQEKTSAPSTEQTAPKIQ
ncbi:MAG: HDIG domain-containing protein [Muribaculaceae bacterium]|nr:HDIG domain-containing protein [Muribaculaceae bacterium]